LREVAVDPLLLLVCAEADPQDVGAGGVDECAGGGIIGVIDVAEVAERRRVGAGDVESGKREARVAARASATPAAPP